MELKDFVSATLIQIVEGVKNAQEFALENNASINPTRSGSTMTGSSISNDFRTVNTKIYQLQDVEFDVAVTAIEGTETKGGVGVAIGMFKLGADGQSNAEKQSVSRIKFKVPVQLPPQEPVD